MILEERFGETAPEVIQAIRAIQDPDRLLDLLRQALRVESLADLDL